MRPLFRPVAVLASATALALCAACAARRASPDPAAAERRYVAALRAEYRAREKFAAQLTWEEGTRGADALAPFFSVDDEPIFSRTAQAALARAATLPGTAAEDALALRFLQQAARAEPVQRAAAPFDAQLSRAESAARVELPFRERPLQFRDGPLALAQEEDPARRAAIYAALTRVVAGELDPILARRESAVQAAARAQGADYVALAEELRGVDLHALLAEGVAYVRATEAIYPATLDRVAREELGLSREALRASDLPRLWKAPRLARYFDPALELAALSSFLEGLGLDLRTAGGGAVRIDDAAHPGKRPRAFVQPVDAPDDVRLSVKPGGGLDDYWALFHEAGHAVHFAGAQVSAPELVTLGSAAASEAFGELFRGAFADPRFLVRYRAFLARAGRPQPTGLELSRVVRRTALAEMACLRRYAFAKIAFELRLHGRPLAELGPALALLPHPALVQGEGEAPLRELYRQLFSVASAVELSPDDARRLRADVDDTFYAADYARAFALAAMLHDALRSRFGEGWTANPAVGPFLRAQLFAFGNALSAEDVAARMGLPPRVDFAAAAARAHRLLAAADALESAGLAEAAPPAASSAAGAAGPPSAAQKAAVAQGSVTLR